jgi:uncharacterized damage-inducible protein DinB
MPRPVSGDYAAFYHHYISLVAEDDLTMAFAKNEREMEAFLTTLPEAKASYAYADGKWTVKQLLQHMIDTERIFAFRALWFARKHPAPLDGFDENEFAAVATAAGRSLSSLITEFLQLRKSTVQLFESFTAGELQQTGLANKNSVTVNALGFIIIGHFLHHRNILTERYL